MVTIINYKHDKSPTPEEFLNEVNADINKTIKELQCTSKPKIKFYLNKFKQINRVVVIYYHDERIQPMNDLDLRKVREVYNKFLSNKLLGRSASDFMEYLKDYEDFSLNSFEDSVETKL